MLPLLLYLILLFGLLLRFPLGVFPLPVLVLKERLYLREQDAGKGLYEQKAESILLTLLYKVNALHTLARNLMQLIAPPARRRPERVPRRRLPPRRPAERRTPLRSSSSISRCSTPASSPRRSLRRRSASCSTSEKA